MEKVTGEKKVAETQKSDVQPNEKAVAQAAEKDAAFKAKKQEAAKRFAENQKAKKEAMIAAAKEILGNKDLFEKLSAETKKTLQDVANPAASSNNGMSFLNKVFGENPKVGDSVTLLEYMKRTLKAKADLDKKIKEWAEKGIVIEVKETADYINNTYTIVKLA